MQTVTMPTPGVLVVSSEVQRVAALRAGEFDAAAPMPDSLSFIQWIVAFEPFIDQRIENQNTTFVLNDVKAPSGDYALAAKVSCVIHNTLPSSMRSTEEIVPERFDAAAANVAGCQDQAKWRTYWWGGSLYMNHCLIQDINGYVGNASKIIGLIGSIFLAIGGGPPGWVLGLIGTFLAVNAGWLQQADTHCGGSGAFLQIPWISPGTPFVKQNC